MSDFAICGSVSSLTGHRCTRVVGHDGDHRWADSGAFMQAIENLFDKPKHETIPCPPPVGDHLKLDYGKDPWHLAPWDAFRAIVKVLAYGAKKYKDRGWEEGMAWSRVHAALLRHLTAWWLKEGVDPETGFSHLWHAGCCICFIIAFEARGIGSDDRP